MSNHLLAKTGLSLERLRTFCDVVAAGGISNAAPGDSNKQSQFSRQLSQLEGFFGAELFYRQRGRFKLTCAGRELFQIVQSHFSAMTDLAKRCANQNVEVTIGAGESLLHWLLLPTFAAFRAQHPTTTLVLENLQTDEIATRLLDRRIEVGLLRQDAVRPPLKFARLGSVQYCLVVPRTSGKLVSEKTAWSALGQWPVALLAGSEIAAAVEGEAEKKGVRLNVCLRGSSYAQLVEIVHQIDCAAVLPTFVAQPLESTSDIVTLTALRPFTRPLVLAWNPQSCTLRPRMENAIASLTDILRKKISLVA